MHSYVGEIHRNRLFQAFRYRHSVVSSCLWPHGLQPGSPDHGIPQGRILEWVVISFSRGSSPPRDGTYIASSSCIGQLILYHWATWAAHFSKLRGCFFWQLLWPQRVWCYELCLKTWPDGRHFFLSFSSLPHSGTLWGMQDLTSWSRGWSCVPFIARQILNWTSREFPNSKVLTSVPQRVPVRLSACLQVWPDGLCVPGVFLKELVGGPDGEAVGSTEK